LTARQPLRLALASCLALSACDELRRCALNAFCRQVADGDCPHVLFYGPSGAGKKTLVLALLREIYGPGVERIKVEAKQWKIDVGSRKVEVDLTLLSSNHHVEMNPSDVGIKDRYIVQEVIKEMARARPIGVDGAKGYKGKRARPLPRCRPAAALTSTRRRAVLVLNEVDKLSKEAQHALRRTMEKYSGAHSARLLHGAAAALPHAAGALSSGRRRGVPPDSAVQQHLARA
jgi:replication factor C subunit 3/5